MRDGVEPATVARAKAGDRKAFEQLYRATAKRIYNFIRAHIRDDDTAADLTQETYVRAWRSMQRLQADQAFPVWLHRIALNLVRDWSRRRRIPEAQPEITEEDDAERLTAVPDWTQNPEKVALSQEAEETVRKAVSALPEGFREVVLMHYLEGMAVQDISAVLGVPVGTVLSRLSRARENLRKRLKRYVEPEKAG
jgi:RNA polymerase sigma-70 factor (ECF subfamily)